MSPITRAERLHAARGMARRLKQLRRHADVQSAAELARALELPASTVRRCEAGQLVDAWRVVVLARAVRRRFALPMEWLICGVGALRLTEERRTGVAADGGRI